MNVQPSTSTNSVVVTGASRNLGAACALHLDKAGFHVFAGVNNQEDGLALQKRASGHLTPLLLDSTDADSIKAATEMVTKAMGETGLAGLVNSATIIVLGPLESLKADELQTQFKINVVDFLAVTQAFLPLLRQGKGRIVNLSSLAGKIPLPFMGAYTASKFAIEALTDALRVELKPWNIEITLVEPEVQTEIISTSLAHHTASPEMQTLYAPMLKYIDEMTVRAEKVGHPVDDTAKAVVAALTAKQPRTRYIVTKFMQWLSLRLLLLFPDRIRDRMLARTFPVYP